MDRRTRRRVVYGAIAFCAMLLVVSYAIMPNSGSEMEAGKKEPSKPRRNSQNKAPALPVVQKSSGGEDVPLIVLVMLGKSLVEPELSDGPTVCPGDSVPGRSTTTPHFTICLYNGEDVISSFFLRDGYWRDCLELPLFAKAAYAASEDQSSEVPVVLDVGANIGTCSLLMASQGMLVTAFEPSQSNAALLRTSIRLNQHALRGNVTLYNLAVSDRVGEDVVRSEKGNMGNSMIAAPDGAKHAAIVNKMDVSNRIRLLPLDYVIYHHVHLAKLDCQGSEVHVLRGAKRLLSQNSIDVIRAEFDTRLIQATGSDPSDLLRILWDNHYSVFDLHDGFVPLRPNMTEAAIASFVEKRKDAPTEVLAISEEIMSPESLQEFTEAKKNGAVDPRSIQKEEMPPLFGATTQEAPSHPANNEPE